jgi:hypothetical protein
LTAKVIDVWGNPAMKNILLPISILSFTSQAVFSAWTWNSSSLTPFAPNIYVLDGGTTATSGTFSLTPLSTSYTPANPGTGITIPPASLAPVNFEWAADRPIQIRLVRNLASPPQVDASFEILLDPDGDGLEATTISFDSIFRQVITDRGVAGGGFAAAVNYLGANLSVEAALFNGFGNQINVVPSMFAYRSGNTINGGPGVPDHFDVDGNGSFSWDNHNQGFATISNGGVTATALPYGALNLAQTVSRQNLTITNNGGDTRTAFRFSFDGGINGVTVIPEPSSIFLVSLAGLITTVIRRRK